MKKFMFAAVMAITAIVSTSCGVIPRNQPIMAAININSVVTDQIVDNNVKPLNCGEATVTGIVLYTTGDASVKAAMANGQNGKPITKIHRIDYKTFNILYLYSKQTTMVWGE